VTEEKIEKEFFIPENTGFNRSDDHGG